MNEIHLSERLKAIAAFIPAGSKIADIGSDHAYLPCYAAAHGLITSAVAGEVNRGPYVSAKNQVESNNLQNIIDVRYGDGLEVIEPNEVDCIVIAGMGGSLITSILDNGKEKLTGVKRLILQPNVAAELVRKWLQMHAWRLINETIIEEEGHIYEILIAETGTMRLSEQEILLGPYLMKEKSDIFIKKWGYELAKWNNVLRQLAHAAPSIEVEQKKKRLEAKIEMVEEVLQQ